MGRRRSEHVLDGGQTSPLQPIDRCNTMTNSRREIVMSDNGSVTTPRTPTRQATLNTITRSGSIVNPLKKIHDGKENMDGNENVSSSDNIFLKNKLKKLKKK